MHLFCSQSFSIKPGKKNVYNMFKINLYAAKSYKLIYSLDRNNLETLIGE